MATFLYCYRWKQLLSTESFKNIIIDSLLPPWVVASVWSPTNALAVTTTHHYQKLEILSFEVFLAAVGRCRRLVSRPTPLAIKKPETQYCIEFRVKFML